MEDHLDAVVEQLNDEIDLKADLTDPRFTDERTPLDNSVTSAKIVNGTIVNADIADATITGAKLVDATVTSAKIAGVEGNTTPMQARRTTQALWLSTNPVLAAGEQGYETDTGLYKTGDGTSTWSNLGYSSTSTTTYLVANQTGSTLLKGTLVAAIGAESTGRIDVAPFDVAGTEDSELRVMGVVMADIANSGKGNVMSFGTLRNIDTRGTVASAIAVGDETWVVGDILFAHPTVDGKLTKVRPQHDLAVAFITLSNATTGQLAIRIDPGNNHLAWMHDVDIDEGTLTDGQALTYDDASGLWVNATPVNSLAGLSDVSFGTLASGQTLVYDGADWINSEGGGGSSITVNATAPSISTAAQGDAWYDSNDGTLYVCYVDVDSTKQWVQVQANSALEGSILARLGALETQSVAFGNLSPNYVINGAFDIWQRGTSFSNPADSSYNADRWRVAHDGTGATRTVSQQAFTAGTAPVAGYESAYFLRYAVSNAGSGNTYQDLNHTIEDVRTLAGQTVTLSFWAKADAARSLNLIWRREWNNYAGADQNNMGPALSLTTSWARYSVTYTVPSLSGITAGTNSNVRLVFRFLAATTQTIDIWGVQLERGSVATAFRRNQPNIQAELAACQRYYYRWTGVTGESLGNVNFWMTDRGWGVYYLPVTMRAVPSINYGGSGWNVLANNLNISVSSLGATSSNVNSFGIDCITTGGAGVQNIGGTVRVNISGGSSYVQAVAEL